MGNNTGKFSRRSRPGARVHTSAHVHARTHTLTHTLGYPAWLKTWVLDLRDCCYHSATSGCQLISIYGILSTENTLNVSEAEMFSVSKQHKQQSVCRKHRRLVIKSLRAIKSNDLDLCYWLSRATHSADRAMVLLHPIEQITPDQLRMFAIFPRFRLSLNEETALLYSPETTSEELSLEFV